MKGGRIRLAIIFPFLFPLISLSEGRPIDPSLLLLFLFCEKPQQFPYYICGPICVREWHARFPRTNMPFRAHIVFNIRTLLWLFSCKICFEQLLKVKKPQQSEQQPHQFNPLPFRRRRRKIPSLYRNFFFTKRSKSKPKRRRTIPIPILEVLCGSICERGIGIFPRPNPTHSRRPVLFFSIQRIPPPPFFLYSIIFFCGYGFFCGGVVSLFLTTASGTVTFFFSRWKNIFEMQVKMQGKQLVSKNASIVLQSCKLPFFTG